MDGFSQIVPDLKEAIIMGMTSSICNALKCEKMKCDVFKKFKYEQKLLLICQNSLIQFL